jgi:hypothetical protein
MSKRLERQRQEWMAYFEREVATKDKGLVGRIDWATAHHYWHTGLTAGDAATKYAAIYKEEEQHA